MLQRTDPAVEVDTKVKTAGAKAIANAVFHATGRSTRELPIMIDKLIMG